jgi:hypothetical protein
MLKPFQEVIGVELHEESARLAEKNLQRNLRQNSDKCQCPNFRILCQDMLTFDFSLVIRSGITTSGEYCTLSLRPPESVVIYLYEPLWTLPKAMAYDLYHSILSNAIYDPPSSVKEVYFVYLFAGMYGGEALSAFNTLISQLPTVLQLVYEGQYFGLFFGYSDNMYIYRATLSALSDTDRKSRRELQEANQLLTERKDKEVKVA